MTPSIGPFNVRTQKELEDAVKKMYNDRKKEGYDGSFKAIGTPVSSTDNK